MHQRIKGCCVWRPATHLEENRPPPLDLEASKKVYLVVYNGPRHSRIRYGNVAPLMWIPTQWSVWRRRYRPPDGPAPSNVAGARSTPSSIGAVAYVIGPSLSILSIVMLLSRLYIDIGIQMFRHLGNGFATPSPSLRRSNSYRHPQKTPPQSWGDWIFSPLRSFRATSIPDFSRQDRIKSPIWSTRGISLGAAK